MPVPRARMRIVFSSLFILLLPFSSGADVFEFPVLVDQENATGGIGDPLNQANSITMSSDGANLYVAGRNGDSVVVLDRNLIDGTISFNEAHQDDTLGVDGLDGAEEVAISPDDRHIYVASDNDDAVAAFERDLGNGKLTFLTAYEQGLGGVLGLDKAKTVTVSPDGECVYAGGESASDSFAVFDRDAGTGLLTFVEEIVNGVGGVTGSERASAIRVSPDAVHVYVAAGGSDAVAVFERAPGMCNLNFVQAAFNKSGGIENMDHPEDIAFSPAGDHVYVAGGRDDSILVFDRNPATGALAFVEFHEDRKNGVSGIDNPQGIAVSPDGSAVYAAGRTSNALARFERDAGTGTLRFVSMRQSKANGYIDVLGSPEGVVVSPDSAHIYTADTGTDGVAAFELQSTLECSALPLVGCREQTQSQVGSITIKDKSNDKADQVKWLWNKGELTQSSDFGDFANTASQALCVYDPTGLIFEGRTIPGSCDDRECWTVKPSGLKYKDKFRSPEGMSNISVKDGLDTKAKLKVKAKGILAAVPTLPAVLRLEVQMQTSDGECWTSTHSTALRNDFEQVKAKSD